MTSIVEQLSIWAKTNATALLSRGVQLTEKFPEPGSTHLWKAGIALAYEEIIVSYTVWERSVFQTELLVMNVSTGKTIIMDDQ